MVQLDARWYNPHSSRFQQPDYWNLRNTHLPTAIQHELMRFTGLNTAQLLNDPSQQLAYGYVSGNPLEWVDPFGLAGDYGFEANIDSSYGTTTLYRDKSLTMSKEKKAQVKPYYDFFSQTFTGLGIASLRSPITAAFAPILGGVGAGLGGLGAMLDEEPTEAMSYEIMSNAVPTKSIGTVSTIVKGIGEFDSSVTRYTDMVTESLKSIAGDLIKSFRGDDC